MSKRTKGRPKYKRVGKRDPIKANRRMLKSCRGVLTAKEAGL